MGAIRTPRGAWIEEGLKALAAGGPDAVRVETLAAALGVSKGGFYGYFRNRDALLAEMLDTWERAVADAVIEQVEGGGGDARTKLDHLFTIATDGEDHPTVGTAAELAVRDWARRDEAVAARVRRVDHRRMEYLRSLYRPICADEDDVEVRCLLTFSVRIAGPYLHVDHAGRSDAEVMALTRQWLLR